MTDTTDDIDQSESDGFHTFRELYEHRHALFMVLLSITEGAWKSRRHTDGSSYPDWFVAGLTTALNEQITYHLPDRLWSQCRAKELDFAPPWDGHSAPEVVSRLYRWANRG